MLLIDVRERSENKSESIEGACSIALDEIALEKLPVIPSLLFYIVSLAQEV